jgi:hypothetical protein
MNASQSPLSEIANSSNSPINVDDSVVGGCMQVEIAKWRSAWACAT